MTTVGIRKSPSGVVVDPRAYAFGDVDTVDATVTDVPGVEIPMPPDSSIRGELLAVGQVSGAPTETPYIASLPFAAVRSAAGVIAITAGTIVETAAGGAQNGNLTVAANVAGDGLVGQVTGVALTNMRWQALMITLRRADSLV